MTLSEVLMASLLLCGSVAASSRLEVSVVAAAMEEEQRQELRERVEAELAAVESQLAQRVGGAVPAVACADSVGQWLRDLAALPAAEGLQRRQAQVTGQALLQVEVDAEGLNEPRRRQYSPAAFGLCGATVPAAGGGAGAAGGRPEEMDG